jgi:mannose-6-phosphate isomerase-like protein (cupin superfamily)
VRGARQRALKRRLLESGKDAERAVKPFTDGATPGFGNDDLRVVAMADVYERAADFFEIEGGGEPKPDIPTPSVVTRTSGEARFRGTNLWYGGAGFHLVQLAEVAPRDRKYLHRHRDAETVWVILDGVGEFYSDFDTVEPVESGVICHAYPGEWHGLGNTGEKPLRYLSVEGPFWRAPAIEFAE